MKKNLKYSEALKQLREIAVKMEDRETDIDQLAELVAKARELSEICRDKLLKIEQDVVEEIKKIDFE